MKVLQFDSQFIVDHMDELIHLEDYVPEVSFIVYDKQNERDAVNVPQKNTRFAFCVILINPPQPATRVPNFETLMFPSVSACARPRKA